MSNPEKNWSYISERRNQAIGSRVAQKATGNHGTTDQSQINRKVELMQTEINFTCPRARGEENLEKPSPRPERKRESRGGSEGDEEGCETGRVKRTEINWILEFRNGEKYK